MYMDLLKKNSRVKLVLLGVIIFAIPIYAQIESFPDSNRCWVDLRCEVSGLDVWVDGEEVGQTPLPTLPLAPGTHMLRVGHPDQSDWLSSDWQKKIVLNEREQKILVVQFPKNIWVGSNPPGASVFYDDQLLGKTPLVVELPAGRPTLLALIKSGYESSRIGLDCSSSSMIHIQLKKEFLKQSGERDSPRLKKKWIVASAVVAILSGVVGYYFKVRADRAYEEYLNSDHPDRMDRYFSDAMTFDRLTGVFYGMGELSLGVSLFLLIHGVRSM